VMDLAGAGAEREPVPPAGNQDRFQSQGVDQESAAFLDLLL